MTSRKTALRGVSNPSGSRPENVSCCHVSLQLQEDGLQALALLSHYEIGCKSLSLAFYQFSTGSEMSLRCLAKINKIGISVKFDFDIRTNVDNFWQKCYRESNYNLESVILTCAQNLT